MPNTLAHIGVQGALRRLAYPVVDLKWVLLGLAVPDLPWMMQRLLRPFLSGEALYDLRLYTVAQSSLFLCAVLCGALALISTAPRITFLVLLANSLLHLGLDALETKFANGVHLLAPLSWKLTNLGLFWPEDPISLVFTLLGLLVLVQWYFRPGPVAVGLSARYPGRVLAAGLLLVAYGALPLVLMPGPYAADNHFVRTLTERSDRRGRPVEFDRNRLVVQDGQTELLTFAGESLRLVGMEQAASGTVSLRGRFVDESTVDVHDLHQHAGTLRDGASYVGLAAVLLVWARSWLGPRRTRSRRG